ncbi:helix-turn-helix domain-containing protein [Haloarcula amylovorans]|uniref:helix-turn-helix domain-containing protein n=1 Tax=Haloarcula amylovorans TaxID=2562280 RepID=UPI00107604A0|nr:helix-turn-helix domain-containing protein [Halomicroarcula amylolytica]
MATIVIGSVPAKEFALKHTLDVLPDVQFECERIIKSGDDAVMPLMWARNVDREELEAAFDEDPSVDNVRMLADFEDEYLYRMDWVDHVELLLGMLTNSEATILDAYGKKEEWRLRVMFPTRDKFSATYEFCNEHGLTYDVESIRDMDGEPAGRFGLTEGQYQALVLAAKEGYYHVPQEKTLEELANELDISHQALSERLRRGTESLIEDTLLVGTDPDLL